MNYYFLGLYLGDGFIASDYYRISGSTYYKMGIVVNQWNKEEILNEMERPFTTKDRLTKDGKYTYCECFTKSQEFIKPFLEYGKNSKEKIFPKEELTEDQFWELASGLIDSDGSATIDNVRFYNTNKKLVEGMSDYLTKLGIKHSCNERQGCLYELVFSNEDINKTKLNLRTQYKRDRYEKLKQKSKGGYVEIDKDFVLKYEDQLKEIYSKSQMSRLKTGKVNKIRQSYYDTIINSK